VSASKPAGNTGTEERDGGVSLPDREPHKFLPSQQQAMALLSMAVPPEDRQVFRDRFQAVATDDGRQNGGATNGIICNTCINWIGHAYGCEAPPLQLRTTGDMFPTSGTESSFQNEFYVMDVILNRSPVPPNTNGETDKQGKQKKARIMRCGDKSAADEVDVGHPDHLDDRVVMFRSYEPCDLEDKNDYKFRTMLLFLPQSGVFYCHRERRGEDVGVLKSLVALDMSWLRLRRVVGAHGSVSYSFGEGGYVKKFYSETRKSSSIHERNTVSAWRISTGRTSDFRQNRIVYRVSQCRDCDGPMLAPDVYFGQETVCWPAACLAAEYNRRLASANSARKDGRHYAPGCHHYHLPATCWIIDPTLTHSVDLIVDDAAVGQCLDRQSIVMIRNLMIIDDDEERKSSRYLPEWDGDTHLIGALNHITIHNEVLRRRSSRGTARAKGGDFGTMHAIGTHVELDGVTTVPYRTNGRVPERLLRNMVVSLSQVGRRCFPQVYSVIRDTETNSGLEPVEPMDGSDGQRVGYTIDMSVDLGNASHFDVHDASQGYSVWTEELRGRGKNWFFIMPNLHGTRPDGTHFAGVAVKLTHGIAISWDGRIIRHCTSLSKPDGPAGKRVGEEGHRNHLYGTFTAAKERIVNAGRILSERASQSKPSPVSGDCGDDGESSDGDRSLVGKKRRRRRKKKRRRGRCAGGATTVVAVDDGVVLVCGAPCPIERPQMALQATSGARISSTASASAVESVPMTAADLDVGGAYKIPRRSWE
jgi:hypothetical protein